MKIVTNNDCEILIYDDTVYPINGLTYEDSVSLYLIWKNLSEQSELIYKKLNTHNGESNLIKLGESEGGYITLCHIILPKYPRPSDALIDDLDEIYVRRKDKITHQLIDVILGLDKEVETISQDDLNQLTQSQSSDFNPNAGLYYFYQDGKFIKQDRDNNFSEVDYSELLEVNPASCNFVKETYNFFSVCQLRKCYQALCLKIFKDRAFDRCFNAKVNSKDIYRRDLVWSALNVIQYMIELNQLAEALRLLERISGCNGLCAGVNTGEDCGCV